MQSHRLIHHMNKPALICTFDFCFSSVNLVSIIKTPQLTIVRLRTISLDDRDYRKLDKSLCILLYIRIMISILFIKINKNVIRYKIEHRLRYINKYVHDATSLQMGRIAIIDKKLDQHNNGRNVLLLDF